MFLPIFKCIGRYSTRYHSGTGIKNKAGGFEFKIKLCNNLKCTKRHKFFKTGVQVRIRRLHCDKCWIHIRIRNPHRTHPNYLLLFIRHQPVKTSLSDLRYHLFSVADPDP